MLHPVAAQAVARARQQDVLKAANASRLARRARKAQPSRPQIAGRIADAAGSLLKDAAQRLNVRHASPEAGARG